MKIYISGKITGCENWEENFNAAEHFIKKQFPKARIYNPVKLSKKVERGKKASAHSDYMRLDLKCLMKCDMVYLLPNWETSKGARAEITVAEACGVTVEKITDDDFSKMLGDYCPCR